MRFKISRRTLIIVVITIILQFTALSGVLTGIFPDVLRILLSIAIFGSLFLDFRDSRGA